jgi:hypothetical protein
MFSEPQTTIQFVVVELVGGRGGDGRRDASDLEE